MERLEALGATTRASFYLYTVEEEIDRLVEGLARVRLDVRSRPVGTCTSAGSTGIVADGLGRFAA